jgi:hypothetical protein
MRRSMPLGIVVLLGAMAIAHAQEKNRVSYPTMAPLDHYRIANAEQEIALARSAAPPAISARAEVLVLGKHGYDVAAKGSNGFVCFVERSWAAGFDDPQFWNPKLRAPNCFNPAAVRTVLPEYLERTQWVLAGLGKEQLTARTRTAFASHRFTEPETGALSFMLSKQGYLNDEAAGPWLPHVMFFVPPGKAGSWGEGLDGSPVLAAVGGAPEPTVLFIPVPHWSDGSPAPAPTEHHHQ